MAARWDHVVFPSVQSGCHLLQKHEANKEPLNTPKSTKSKWAVRFCNLTTCSRSGVCIHQDTNTCHVILLSANPCSEKCVLCLLQVRVAPWCFNAPVSLSRLGDKLRISLDFMPGTKTKTCNELSCGGYLGENLAFIWIFLLGVCEFWGVSQWPQRKPMSLVLTVEWAEPVAP